MNFVFPGSPHLRIVYVISTSLNAMLKSPLSAMARIAACGRQHHRFCWVPRATTTSAAAASSHHVRWLHQCQNARHIHAATAFSHLASTQPRRRLVSTSATSSTTSSSTPPPTRVLIVAPTESSAAALIAACRLDTRITTRVLVDASRGESASATSFAAADECVTVPCVLTPNNTVGDVVDDDVSAWTDVWRDVDAVYVSAPPGVVDNVARHSNRLAATYRAFLRRRHANASVADADDADASTSTAPPPPLHVVIQTPLRPRASLLGRRWLEAEKCWRDIDIARDDGSGGAVARRINFIDERDVADVAALLLLRRTGTPTTTTTSTVEPSVADADADAATDVDNDDINDISAASGDARHSVIRCVGGDNIDVSEWTKTASWVLSRKLDVVRAPTTTASPASASSSWRWCDQLLGVDGAAATFVRDDDVDVAFDVDVAVDDVGRRRASSFTLTNNLRLTPADVDVLCDHVERHLGGGGGGSVWYNDGTSDVRRLLRRPPTSVVEYLQRHASELAP